MNLYYEYKTISWYNGRPLNKCTVIKKYKFHQYKIQLLQKLNEDVFDRRLQLCVIVAYLVNHKVNFLFDISFTNASNFSLSV